MAEKGYLKPKVTAGRIGERIKHRGLFVNVPGYVKYGGFTSADKYGRTEDVVLERGVQARQGKPI